MEPIAELPADTVIAGKYRLERLLGRGGMGAVYLAENLDIGRKVALKLLRPELAADSESLARFRMEARAAAAIGHPGVVDIFDFGASESGAYLVMERLEGETLLEHMRRVGRLTAQEAVEIVASVLDTLAVAHAKGVVHRDLKPDNVFLVAGPPRATKILDFGISKFRLGQQDLALTRTGTVMGTPRYMSPEQARGARDVGPPTDLYSAGAILYEALSGQPPFPGDSYNEVLANILTTPVRPLATLAAEVGPDLCRAVEMLLAKPVAERPVDARAAAALLRAAVAGSSLVTTQRSSSSGGGLPVDPLGATTPSARPAPPAAAASSVAAATSPFGASRSPSGGVVPAVAVAAAAAGAAAKRPRRWRGWLIPLGVFYVLSRCQCGSCEDCESMGQHAASPRPRADWDERSDRYSRGDHDPSVRPRLSIDPDAGTLRFNAGKLNVEIGPAAPPPTK